MALAIERSFRTVSSGDGLHWSATMPLTSVHWVHGDDQEALEDLLR